MVQSPCPYKGVSYVKKRDKWKSQITADYKVYFLGEFLTEVEAALAYNAAAIKHFGEFAYLNEIDGLDESAIKSRHQLIERIADLEAELKRKDAALRLIAFGDAQDWPGCSSRKVAEAALSPAPSDGDAV